MNVQGIKTHELDAIWPQVLPLLSRALKHGDGGMNLDDIRKALSQRLMQLWCGFIGERVDFVLVTSIEARGAEKILKHQYAAGESAAGWIAEGLGLVEEWARHEGATVAELLGRRGWIKRLPGPWRERWVVMQRAL